MSDDMWPIGTIAEMIGADSQQLSRLSKKRKSNGFPEPVATLGKYHLFSLKEVQDWWDLWQKVTTNMRRARGERS
jgi:hypothetical protein